MSEQLITSAVTVILAIVGVAFLSVLLSRNSQTSSVLSSAGTSVSGVLQSALLPVTSGFSGGAGLPNLSFLTLEENHAPMSGR